MAHVPKDPKYQTFAATLGELVIHWNGLEKLIISIVSELAGGGPETQVLTANLGNVALREALVTLGNETADDALKPHIQHFGEFFDRLREHRNWLVHSVVALAEQNGVVIGISSTQSARVRLLLHQKLTQIEELQTCIQWAETLSWYGTALFLDLLRVPSDKLPPGYQ